MSAEPRGEVCRQFTTALERGSRARSALALLRALRTVPQSTLPSCEPRQEPWTATPLESGLAGHRRGTHIGRAIALALADAGAKVAVNVRVSRDEGRPWWMRSRGAAATAVLVVGPTSRKRAESTR